MAAGLLAGTACIILATLAGPHFVKRGVQKFVVREDGQNLDIGAAQFNPFTLSAGLDDLRLTDADGTAILLVDHMRLDFSIAGLFRRQIVLSEVSIQQPRLSLDISVAASRSRFTDLIGPLSPQDSAAGSRRGLRIELGLVHGGTVRLHDDGASLQRPIGDSAPKTATTEPAGFLFSGLELKISDFQSGSDEAGGLTLSANVNESATLRAEGKLVPVTGALEASVQVSGLDLAAVTDLMRPNSGSVRLAGMLQADGLLRHDAAGTQFSGELAIRRFQAGAMPDAPAVFSADELSVSGADISIGPLRASAQFMQLRQPRLELLLSGNKAASNRWAGTPVLSHWLRGAFGPRAAPAVSKATVPVNWLPSIDALAIEGGRVSLVDTRLSDPVYIELNHVTGGISSHAAGQAAARGRTVIVQLSGNLADSSPVILDSLVQLSAGQTGHDGRLEGGIEDGSEPEVLGAIKLQKADAALFSSYFEQFTAREIASGKLDLGLSYHLQGSAIAVTSKVSFKDLLLGARTGSDPDEDSSSELALALLTDPFGEISFELPILSRAGDPAKAIVDAFTAFVSGVTAKPFDLLASLSGFGGTGLNVVGFEPGSAAITAAAEQQLRALGEALKQRPALGLRVMGGLARQADRTALARQQIQLHVALAASTRPSGRPEQAVLDFADPKVQVVLEEFASARLAANELAELKLRQGSNGKNTVNAQIPGAAEYYRKVFEALVAKERVGDKAVRQLARYRAQSVIRQLESLGIAAGRLQLGSSDEADDQPVLLEVFAVAATAASSSDSDRATHSAAASSLAHGIATRVLLAATGD